MLDVSSDFKSAIASDSRVIKSRVSIAFTEPFISATAITSSTEDTDSDKDKVFDGIGLSDYFNDGVFRGFQSSATCDASNDFASAQELDVSFADKSVNHIEVKGDNVTGEYPVDFTVTRNRLITLSASNTVVGRAVLTTGVFDSTTTYGRSDYIAVNDGDVITWSYVVGTFTARVTLYDSSNAWLQDLTSTLSNTGNITINNASAAYIVITLYYLGFVYSLWPSFAANFNINITTESVTGNDALKWTDDFTADTFNVISLSITKWSAPSTTAKITSFTTRTVQNFDDDDIITMDIDEEIEPDGGTVFGTAIAKQAELKLSNFEDIYSNDIFYANRTFYPEIGVDVTIQKLADAFTVDTDYDLNVDDVFTTATDTTWDLDANQELNVEDVSSGDYVIAENNIYANEATLERIIEYAPMGIYYVTDWKLSDDRYYLLIKGLDAIGYIATQKYTNDMTTSAFYTLEDYLSDIVTDVLPTYSVVTDFDTGTDTELNVRLTTDLRTALNKLSLRDYLSKLVYSGVIGISAAIPVIISKSGLVYIQSSRWESKLILIGKFAQVGSTSDYDETVTINNYFKANNYRNDYNATNTFKLVTFEGVVSSYAVSERVAVEGAVTETFDNTYFITNESVSSLGYYLQKLYQNQQSEVMIDWRGNPAYELGDNLDIQIARRGFPVKTLESQYNFGYIVSNHYKYDGGLRCTTRLKALETGTVSG